jgi:cell division protein FtsB
MPLAMPNLKLPLKPRGGRARVVRRLRLGALAVAGAWLLQHAVFSAGGYLTWRREQQAYGKVETRVKQLQQRNRELNASVRELSSNPQAIESIAREQLHLTKPGEVVYTFPTKPSSGDDALAYSRAGMRPAR